MENIENKNAVELNEQELDEVVGGKGGKGKRVKATGDVHVRKYADKESADLGILYTGDTAPYMGDKKTDYRGVVWYKIAFHNGKGWVSSKYSKLV